MTDDKHRGAVLSEDERYRYLLWRGTPQPTKQHYALILGCNPSTADAHYDDHTIRKERQFVRRWDCDGFYKGNVCGLRSTDPRELKKAEDPIGPDNESWIRTALGIVMRDAFLSGTAPLVVVAWGEALPKSLRHHTKWFLDYLRDEVNIKPMCLGYTKTGQPRHPLMLGYETKLVPYEAP